VITAGRTLEGRVAASFGSPRALHVWQMGSERLALPCHNPKPTAARRASSSFRSPGRGVPRGRRGRAAAA